MSQPLALPQTIEELIPDDQNHNRHSERGMGLLENALRHVGAGRSILIDRNNKIIAGNGVVEAAVNAGILRLRVVETDGNEIVAVRRRDVDRDSPLGEELAQGDNIIGQRNQDIDWDVVNAQAQEYELDLERVGVSQDELRKYLEMAASIDAARGGGVPAELSALPPAEQSERIGSRRYGVTIYCPDEENQAVLLAELQQRYGAVPEYVVRACAPPRSENK